MARASAWFLILVLGLLGSESVSAQSVPPQARPTPPTTGEIREASRDRSLLVMMGAIFDPLAGIPDFRAVGFPPSGSGRYGIVQFNPGEEGRRHQLEAESLSFLSYLPHSAYQVRWTDEGRALLENHPAVRWYGDYPPGLKVSPELWPADDRSLARIHSPTGIDGINVVAFEPDALSETVEAIRNAFPRLGAPLVVRDAVFPRALYSVPRVAIERFVRVASRLDTVSWIEPWRRPTLHNSGSVGPIQANAPVSALAGNRPLWAQGLIGTGQIIAFVDSGLDRNQCWFTQHAALDGTVTTSITDAVAASPAIPGPLFPQNKVVGYWVQPGATAYDNDETCGERATSFHGTHVAGTLAGDRGLPSSPQAPNSFDPAASDGMAPNAQLLVQDIGDDASGCLQLAEKNVGALFFQAHGGGARLHNNSWGSNTNGTYVSTDREVDDALWRLEDMLAVFAAGNEGDTDPPTGPIAQTIGSPGNAKNGLTVAALGHGNSLSLMPQSSRGPTLDGRNKPDVAAPGTAVHSARGDTGNSAPACPATLELSGTSMAAPAVTGGAALLRQYFTDGFYPTGAPDPNDAFAPSGALMKAVLLNGTRRIGNLPNYDTGWGRIWLHRSLPFAGDPQRLRVWSKDHLTGLAVNEVDVYEIDSQGGALRVTLAWFDRAATPGAASTLVNDLELEVVGPNGTVFRGNVLSGGNSSPGGAADVLNTVEHIRLPSTVPGTYSVRVIASHLPATSPLFQDRQGYGLAATFDACQPAPTSPPTGLTAVDDGATGIEVSFDSVPAATVYQVYRAEGDCRLPAAAFELIGTTGGTDFLDTTALGGSTYAYRVRAADRCGEGPASACVSTTSTVPNEFALCAPEPVGWPPRPRWQDVLGPDRYPSYEEISENFNILNSLELLASLVTRAMAELQNLTNSLDTDQMKGLCVCTAGTVHQDLTRDQCNSQCTSVQAWLPTDIFKDEESTALFTLEYLGVLGKVKDDLQEATGPIVQALEAVGSGIEETTELIETILDYIDRFTEGYHLGDYSSQRPDLHLCVGYGGHGVYAELADLLGGEVSIGGRYTSHNLSDRHRAQFRSGGFGVEAFGRPLSLLPGIEADLQMDGFRLWDADKPFGIDFGDFGQGSISVSEIESVDLFHLVDEDVLADIAGTDGRIQPAELVIKDFYRARYTPPGASQVFEWPRLEQVEEPWEGPSIAVLSAGLNLPLELVKIEKELPPIVIGAFTVIPDFALEAGVTWVHDANRLRGRIAEMVNQNLPDDPISDEDFGRPMHDFQADDLTGDNGTEAAVKPEVGATVSANLGLARWAALSLAFRLGLGVSIEPAAYGGIADLNRALADALLESNPPQDAICEAADFDKESELTCSNLAFEGSTGEYVCGEDDNGGTNGDDEEPVRCEERGYCATNQNGEIVPVGFDVSRQECDSLSWSVDEGEIDEDTRGACCYAGPAGPTCGEHFSKHACRNRAVGISYPGKSCAEIDCSGQPLFFPYTCLEQIAVEPTSWEGPGCHPLSSGFPSACVCSGNGDCAPGEACGQDGLCLPDGAESGRCDCQTDGDCSQARRCVEGGCLKRCTGDPDCGDAQVCDPDEQVCVSEFGIPFAEQVAWGVANVEEPRHAIWTYALSEIETYASLSAALKLELILKVWRRTFSKTIFDFSDWWNLFSARKSRYQVGLEARYENDCTPQLGTVSNRQPGADFVRRYNPQNAQLIPGAPLNAYDDNAGRWDELVGWCLDELPSSAVNPDAPAQAALAASVVDVIEWGQDVGTELFARQRLCIGGQPIDDWLNAIEEEPGSLRCKLDDGTAADSFPCSDATRSLLEAWPCLDANANPFAVALASHFNGISAENILQQVDGRTIFNLDAVLIDPAGQLELANLKNSIRLYRAGPRTRIAARWLQTVEHCFDQRFAALDKDDFYVEVGEIGSCCGNGAVEPPEHCDDGNTDSGDGCNALCRQEAVDGEPPCPDPADPAVSYISRDPADCAHIRLFCPGGRPFVDECGCGCRDAGVCVPVPTDLRRWWPLDETLGAGISDTLGSTSGASRPGDIGITGPSSVDGVVGRALRFDGLDDYVEITDQAPLDFGPGQDLTIDFWIRTEQSRAAVLEKRELPPAGGGIGPPDDRHPAITLLARTGASAPVGGSPIGGLFDFTKPTVGYSIYILDGRPGLQLADGQGDSICSPRADSSCTNFSADIRIDDGEWHHVAVAVDRDDPDGGRWYIDGQERPEARFNPTVRSGSLANAAPLRLARSSGSASGIFRGTLDEVEIFARALSESEIQALRGAGRHGKCRQGDVSCQHRPPSVQFTTLDRGSSSVTGAVSRLEVIRSQVRLEQVYGELGLAAGPHSVDFSREMVLFYTMGTQPNGCYTTEIESVHVGDGRILTGIEELEPSSGCGCTFSLVQPYHLVRTAAQPGIETACVRREKLICPQ